MHVLAMTPGNVERRLSHARARRGFPNAIIETNQLRETTPTEKPRSFKEAGVEHKASNLVSKNHIC